jgi:hypothetical protein
VRKLRLSFSFMIRRYNETYSAHVTFSAGFIALEWSFLFLILKSCKYHVKWHCSLQSNNEYKFKYKSYLTSNQEFIILIISVFNQFHWPFFACMSLINYHFHNLRVPIYVFDTFCEFVYFLFIYLNRLSRL